MRDEQWEQIKPAAEAHHRAKLAYENAGMMNRPIDHREAIEASVRYERLREEFFATMRELEATKRRVLG